MGKSKHDGNISFNTQPPEGGWFRDKGVGIAPQSVSTHSRPKAAGRREPTTAPNC